MTVAVPACEAMIEQVRLPVMWTVAGEVAGLTVQGPLAASETGRPGTARRRDREVRVEASRWLIEANVMFWVLC